MASIRIGSPEADLQLCDLQRTGGITCLVGSSISVWEPSNLPSGQQVTEELAQALADSTVSPLQTVRDLIKTSAFEHLMERYPKPHALAGIVAKSFYPTTPNPVHKTLARLIEACVVEHLITPNYDVGLEEACSIICTGARKPQVVVTEDDAKHLPSKGPVIFKIHGCASRGREDTMVMALREEGVMPEWKRLLLKRLTDGRPLLVCGYSGLDFEICPELILLKPSSLTWNSFRDPLTDDNALTANASRVLKQAQGTVLVGDMRSLIGTLQGVPCLAKPSTRSRSFVHELITRLDAWELDKWRVSVFNGLSCARDGIETGRRMVASSGTSRERRVDSLLGLAEARFHSALYFQAADTYEKAAILGRGFIPRLNQIRRELADAESKVPCNTQLSADLLEQISQFLERLLKADLGVVESYRGAGYWFKARRRIERLSAVLPRLAPQQLRAKVESEIALKRVLLQRYPYYLTRKLGLRLISNRLRSAVQRELSAITAHFAGEGSWFNLQHCEMLAKRFDLDYKDIYSGTMTPLAASDGYKQLGYILAEMMAYRATLSDSSVTAPVLNYRYFLVANELGIHAEVWKLALAIENRFGKQALTADAIAQAESARRTCEYTWLMKVLRAIRGSDP